MLRVRRDILTHRSYPPSSCIAGQGLCSVQLHARAMCPRSRLYSHSYIETDNHLCWRKALQNAQLEANGIAAEKREHLFEHRLNNGMKAAICRCCGNKSQDLIIQFNRGKIATTRLP